MFQGWRDCLQSRLEGFDSFRVCQKNIMTTRELIERLLKLPLDIEVVFGVEDGDDMGGYIVPIKVENPRKIYVETNEYDSGLIHCYNGDEGIPIVVIQTDEPFVYRGLNTKQDKLEQ